MQCVVPPWAGDSYGIDPLAPTTWPAEDSEHAAPVAGPTTHTAHSQAGSAKRLAGFWVKTGELVTQIIWKTFVKSF